jgi:hypothetical protein
VAKAKYSALGDPKALRFLEDAIQEADRGLLEASLAASTWNKLNSAKNNFDKFKCATACEAEMPYSVAMLCKYVSWALTQESLKPSTVRSYLSAIKTTHKLRNMDCDTSNYLIQSLLKGAENLSLYSQIVAGSRKVMTLQLLKLLGHQLTLTDWTTNSKKVIWAACVLAFFGSFRFGEILAKETDKFNPMETLLWSDVNFTSEKSVIIRVKLDKNRTPQGSYIDLFEFKGHNCCPITVLKGLKMDAISECNPVFQFKNGKLLNSKTLNSCIKDLLQPIIGEHAQLISGHSFRAALPSAMANDPIATKDTDIKQWGRWSSDSYLLYTRLKLKQKETLFKKIVDVLNKS